jgi:hypothetical protein
MTNTSLHAEMYLSLPRKRESIVMDSYRHCREGNDDASAVGEPLREADICFNTCEGCSKNCRLTGLQIFSSRFNYTMINSKSEINTIDIHYFPN